MTKIILTLALLLASCISQRVPSDPPINIEYQNGTKPEPGYDEQELKFAEKGCPEYYGPKWRLKRLIKTAKRSWRAICAITRK